MARKRYAADQSVLQNAAKTLFANIRFASVDDPIKSIVVTSSVPNEGKSTVSVNLAEAIASSGKTVLIVECDMRKRSLYRALGTRTASGLYAVLTEQVSPDQAIVPTRYENLYFLDVEPSIPNPADIISSKRFGKLLAVLENHYDYVLLDTPPVGAFVDAAILATLADATVFVVRENFAKRAEIAAAFEQLKKADANIIGAVLNYCEDESSSSSYYYYDYYNGSSKSSKDFSHTTQAVQPQQVQQPVKAAGKRFK